MDEAPNFGVFDWMLLLAFLLTLAVWAGLIFLLVLAIRKYIRFRRSIVGNEDLLEEIADLHRDVFAPDSGKGAHHAAEGLPGGPVLRRVPAADGGPGEAEEPAALEAPAAGEEKTDPPAVRFTRLAAVDEKYIYYAPPAYEHGMTLKDICADMRNFACTNNGLYYDERTIRLMISGFACTKWLVILQGISGTGKTSLPYMMGKYFQNDATIASVQPSWRDRTSCLAISTSLPRSSMRRTCCAASTRPGTTMRSTW